MAYVKKYDDDKLLKFKNPTPQQQAFLEAAHANRNQAIKAYRRRKGMSVQFGFRDIDPKRWEMAFGGK